MNSIEPAAKRRRTAFWTVAAVFLLPVAIAAYLYYAPSAWRPAGSVNHGALIDPARPLPAIALPMLNGSRTAPDFLRRHWTLLYIGAGQCDERCREALYQMRQVRLALNQDMARVERVFLAAEPCCDKNFLDKEHPGLLVASAATPEARELLRDFPTDTGPLMEAGRIYVIDPLGNLMMAHPRDSQPKFLLEDLKRLLKLSAIG